MQVYCRIIELGGFGKAADALSLPRASVSLAIQQLESHLGMQLLQRTTRRVRATLEGQRYYQRCQQLLADLDDLESEVAARDGGPRGVLRVDLPAAFGCRWVVPHLADFYARYPNMQLDLGFNDRHVHLQREGVDCALRAGTVGDPGLVARPVARVPQLTCASPGYLARHGTPQRWEALQHGHLMVNFPASNGQYFPLVFERGAKPVQVSLPGVISVDNADAYVGAAVAGFGLVQLPRYHVEQALEAGSLVPVLPALPVPHWPIAVVYPPHRHHSPRLRVFIDWVLQRVAIEAGQGAALLPC
nr:LysR family transcriptional regulator [Pseudomonas typographi]